MRRPITTKQHAWIDYVWALAMPIVPRLLGAGPAARGVMRAASGLGAAETALTDFEGGVKGILPMQGHLAMDAVVGVALIGTAIYLKDESPLVRGFLASAGVVALAAATMTQPIPKGAGRQHAQRVAGEIGGIAGAKGARLAGAR